MDLTKEALAYLEEQSLSAAAIKETSSGQEVSAVKHHVIEEPRAAALQVTTLSAIVDYLKTQVDTKEPMLLHIASPTQVCLYSAVNTDKKRDFWLCSEAIIPGLSFDHWYDLETLNIKLQSGFANTDQAKMLKSILGNVVVDNGIVRNDDGVSQSVATKQSIRAGEYEDIPSRIQLQPYRTFVEVAQPASDFIFRLKDNGGDMYAKLVEADGGAWKIAAIQNIREWLTDQLGDHDLTGEKTLLDTITIVS